MWTMVDTWNCNVAGHVSLGSLISRCDSHLPAAWCWPARRYTLEAGERRCASLASSHNAFPSPLSHKHYFIICAHRQFSTWIWYRNQYVYKHITLMDCIKIDVPHSYIFKCLSWCSRAHTSIHMHKLQTLNPNSFTHNSGGTHGISKSYRISQNIFSSFVSRIHFNAFDCMLLLTFSIHKPIPEALWAL